MPTSGTRERTMPRSRGSARDASAGARHGGVDVGTAPLGGGGTELLGDGPDEPIDPGEAPAAVFDWQDIDGRWYRVGGGSEGAARAIVEITDLKRAEAALRQNEQRFRDFAAASAEAAAAMRRSEASLAKAQRIARLGNWDLRVRSNEMSWSDEIYRIFGLANDAAPATYDLFLDMVHPDDRAPVEAAIKAALYTGARYVIARPVAATKGGYPVAVRI
jgi:PAS domain-containing protein